MNAREDRSRVVASRVEVGVGGIRPQIEALEKDHGVLVLLEWSEGGPVELERPTGLRRFAAGDRMWRPILRRVAVRTVEHDEARMVRNRPREDVAEQAQKRTCNAR